MIKSSEIENMVLRYFAGVDTRALDGIFQTLSDTCRFTVETHGVELIGREAITGMFRRLWGNHKAVHHDQFKFVINADKTRVAVQFRVTNTLHNGDVVYKSNCNFFEIENDQFCSVNVYMAGENTLDADNST